MGLLHLIRWATSHRTASSPISRRS
jgi:hypothetical protein